MDYEWDERKRRAHIQKHGFDLADAEAILGGDHFRAPAKSVGGERRWLERDALSRIRSNLVLAINFIGLA